MTINQYGTIDHKSSSAKSLQPQVKDQGRNLVLNNNSTSSLLSNIEINRNLTGKKVGRTSYETTKRSENED